MSYASQAALVVDEEFQDRGSAAVFGQAVIFKDDGRADLAALAKRHMRVPAEIPVIWAAFLAAAPGFADQPESSAITDADILAAVQSGWPTVAAVHYNPDGSNR